MIGNGDVFCPKSAKAMIEHMHLNVVIHGYLNKLQSN